MTDEKTEHPPADDEPTVLLAEQMAGDAQKPLAETAGKIDRLPPGIKLASNLDLYEKERPEEPFWFQHDGEYFRLLDPDDVDFQDLMIGQENPRLMLHVLLAEDQRDRFFAKGLSVGRMKKLVLDYTRHFGLTDLGELAGSARSLNGMQGR